MKILFSLSFLLFSQDLSYGPYLNMVTDSSVNIRYGFSNPKKSWFSWGIYPRCDMYLTFFAPQKNITTTLYALQPEKEYCYILYLPVEDSTFSYIASSATFYTLNTSSTSSFNFLVFTDINGGFNEKLKDSLGLVIDTDTRFAIYFGSITKTEENDIPSYFLNYSSFISKLPFYIPLIEYNFDYERTAPVADFSRYFHFSSNGVSPYYYYVDVGGVRVIFIDTIKSQLDKRFLSRQIEWLKKTLSSTSKDWVFIVSNSIIYHSDPQQGSELKNISDIIESHNVDFIIQFGDIKYARRKNLTTDSIIIWLGEKKREGYKEEFFDFASDIDGIVKVSVQDKKVEVFYLSYALKEVDHLVYQK